MKTSLLKVSLVPRLSCPSKNHFHLRELSGSGGWNHWHFRIDTWRLARLNLHCDDGDDDDDDDDDGDDDVLAIRKGKSSKAWCNVLSHAVTFSTWKQHTQTEFAEACLSWWQCCLQSPCWSRAGEGVQQSRDPCLGQSISHAPPNSNMRSVHSVPQVRIAITEIPTHWTS